MLEFLAYYFEELVYIYIQQLPSLLNSLYQRNDQFPLHSFFKTILGMKQCLSPHSCYKNWALPHMENAMLFLL